MRGRESLDDIQNFLEMVIIRCFTSKYTLLPKRREAVAPGELDLWSLYKSQEEYFKGNIISKFIFNNFNIVIHFLISCKLVHRLEIHYPR